MASSAHARAEGGIDRRFLHRCCVQFSAPLETPERVEAEQRYALRFLQRHAATHAAELARALVWRVADSDAGTADWLGAWALLQGAIRACCTDAAGRGGGGGGGSLAHTTLADRILPFMPHLIEHRWHSTRPRISGDGGSGPSGGGDRRLGARVVPAAALVGRGAGGAAADGRTPQQLAEQRLFFDGLLDEWRRQWRAGPFRLLHERAVNTRRHGNQLTEKAAACLHVPTAFRDSLWRLRRSQPLPSTALHVLYCYGLDALPAAAAELEAAEPAMHPTARQWLERLIKAGGGCALCESWAHTEVRCPCETPFRRAPILTLNILGSAGGEEVPAMGRRGRRVGLAGDTAVAGAGEGLTYMRAVDRLREHRLTLPLRLPEALDAVMALIVAERPADDLIDAMDTVRGARTGPLERHALWVLAHYRLPPSAVLFAKPSDDALSPLAARVEASLRARRRFREWAKIRTSIDVLDAPFRRRALPAATKAHLDEIWSTYSYFFCLIDGSLPRSYTPGLYARAPEDVLAAAPIRDMLCPYCLDPFHSAARCTQPKEPWDLMVARDVLTRAGLLNAKYPDERYKVDAALAAIDADDRPAKEFRKKELELAVLLVLARREPVCEECAACVGHATRACPKRAARVLREEGLSVAAVRLDPRGARAAARRHGSAAPERQYAVYDAITAVLGRDQRRALPGAFKSAVDELRSAAIPLAAARYSTEAVRSFLLSVGSADLLPHLAPLAEPHFPEVCLLCSSLDHVTDDCADCKEEEWGFLQELRRAGLDLWAYARERAYYDERLPFEQVAGKRSLLRIIAEMDEDYAPGGLGRLKFAEANGLPLTGATAAPAGAAAGSPAADAAPGRLRQQRELSALFSRLIPIGGAEESSGGGGGASSSNEGAAAAAAEADGRRPDGEDAFAAWAAGGVGVKRARAEAEAAGGGEAWEGDAHGDYGATAAQWYAGSAAAPHAEQMGV